MEKNLFTLGQGGIHQYDVKNGKKTKVRDDAGPIIAPVIVGNKMYWRRENEIYEFDMKENEVEKYGFKNGNDGNNGGIMSCAYQFHINNKFYFVGGSQHILEYDLKSEKLDSASKEKIKYSLRHAIQLGNKLVFLQTDTSKSNAAEQNVISVFDPETRDIKEIKIPEENFKKFFGSNIYAFSHA